MVKVISVFKETEETELGVFDSQKDALLAIANDIEWEEGDDPHDYVFRIEECDEDYEEPADIDDDCGFDPYCGCYTYDCQGVATMRDLFKIVVWFFVINFSICNSVWTEPVSYWWIIEIIVLIISILMVDKPVKKQYYNYRKKKREVNKMKIYVFDTINGVVIRKAAKSIDEAIAWFKETYPTRAFSCVYEQQTQEK